LKRAIYNKHGEKVADFKLDLPPAKYSIAYLTRKNTFPPFSSEIVLVWKFHVLGFFKLSLHLSNLLLVNGHFSWSKDGSFDQIEGTLSEK
jgi:hypothetical protein